MCIGGRHLPFIIIYGKWSINNQHPAISVKSAKNMIIYPNGLRTGTSTYALLKFLLGENRAIQVTFSSIWTMVRGVCRCGDDAWGPPRKRLHYTRNASS
jgi:hypothetical protein